VISQNFVNNICTRGNSLNNNLEIGKITLSSILYFVLLREA